MFVFIYLVIYLWNTAELYDENDPCCAGDLLDVQFNLNFVALDSDLTSCKSTNIPEMETAAEIFLLKLERCGSSSVETQVSTDLR